MARQGRSRAKSDNEPPQVKRAVKPAPQTTVKVSKEVVQERAGGKGNVDGIAGKQQAAEAVKPVEAQAPPAPPPVPAAPPEPPLLFEIGWEVCWQLGGIYAVLKSEADAMINRWDDRYCLIGPYNPATAALE